jgi:hypothetical protein
MFELLEGSPRTIEYFYLFPKGCPFELYMLPLIQGILDVKEKKTIMFAYKDGLDRDSSPSATDAKYTAVVFKVSAIFENGY